RRGVFESPLLVALCQGARVWYFVWHYLVKARKLCDGAIVGSPYGFGDRETGIDPDRRHDARRRLRAENTRTSMSPDDFQAEAAALQAIVEGTASETGAAFFDALVKNLAMALGTRCAWVTEWIPEGRRLRALSFWARDHYVLGYEYPIEGTPCAAVIEERQLIHVPEQLLELFPDDPDLAPLDAHSYMGVPLVDEDGRMLGHLAVMDDAP